MGSESRREQLAQAEARNQARVQAAAQMLVRACPLAPGCAHRCVERMYVCVRAQPAGLVEQLQRLQAAHAAGGAGDGGGDEVGTDDPVRACARAAAAAGAGAQQ